MKPEDITYLKLAIEKSRQSLAEGNFPAGAVVVSDGTILASAVSSTPPYILHADSQAVITAFRALGTLPNATLYVGLEPCLMCTSVAYWAGVRRIVYAVPKTRVSGKYYETGESTSGLVDRFHEPVIRIHIPELEQEAISIIRDWERQLSV